MEKTYTIFADSIETTDQERAPRQVLGLFVGIPLLLPRLRVLSKKGLELPVLQLREVSPLDPTDDDELAEFRLLNNKDRVIIRGLGDGRGPMILGRTWDKDCKTLNYITFDMNGTLIVPGPVVIEKIDEGGPIDGGDYRRDKVTGHEKDHRVMSSQSVAKYYGHLTLNLGGERSIIQLKVPVDNSALGTKVTFLGRHGNFTIEKLVPHRFQQRTIVQRQREAIQWRNGLLALETFDDGADDVHP